MKKTLICFCISFFILISMILAVSYATLNFAYDIDAPESRLVIDDNGNLVITWTPVNYATSYRIFAKETEGWKLLKVLPAKERSYLLPEGYTSEKEYAMRACNGSREIIKLSDYSFTVVDQQNKR